jgi:hypothetical protein
MRNAEQANREVMALPKVQPGIAGMLTAWSNARKVKSLKKELRDFLEYAYGKELSPAVKEIMWKHATDTEAPTFNSIQKRYIERMELAGDYLVAAGVIMGR